MATTTAKKKTASTAKHKTTKPAAKKTASAPTKTSVKNVTSTKAKQPTKSAIGSKKSIITPFEKLRGLHLSNVFSGVILAVLSIIFVSPQTRELLLNYQAKDTFVISDNVVLGTATESLFSLDIRWILVVILGLTAVVSLLLATRLFKRYETTVKSGISGMRWLLYGFVTMIVVELASLLAGVNEVNTLKTIGALVLAASLFSWLAERENNEAKSPKKLAFYAAVFAYVFALIPMIVSLVATSVIGGERFSWYVYVVGVVVVLSSVATLVTLKSSIVNKKKFEYVAFEQRYIRIDQIAKFAIVLTIFSAFNK